MNMKFELEGWDMGVHCKPWLLILNERKTMRKLQYWDWKWVRKHEPAVLAKTNFALSVEQWEESSIICYKMKLFHVEGGGENRWNCRRILMCQAPESGPDWFLGTRWLLIENEEWGQRTERLGKLEQQMHGTHLEIRHQSGWEVSIWEEKRAELVSREHWPKKSNPVLTLAIVAF